MKDQIYIQVIKIIKPRNGANSLSAKFMDQKIFENEVNRSYESTKSIFYIDMSCR